MSYKPQSAVLSQGYRPKSAVLAESAQSGKYRLAGPDIAPLTSQTRTMTLPENKIGYDFNQISSIAPTISKDPEYQKKVQYAYEQVVGLPNSAKYALAIGEPLTNVLNIPSWLSKKFGFELTGDVGAAEKEHKGTLSAVHDAVNIWRSQVPVMSPMGAAKIGGGIARVATEFKGMPGANPVVKFAAQEALTAPTTQQSEMSLADYVAEKGTAVSKAALTGAAVMGAQKYIPNPLFRVPTVTGGFMGLTALEGGTPEEILESGITVLGFEALGLVEKGLGPKQIAEAARRHNPELNKVPDNTIRSTARQIIDSASQGVPTKTSKPVKALDKEPEAPLPPEIYHGTGTPIEKLSDTSYSTLNYYGQGFYTTDNRAIAEGYSRKGGKTPTVYNVKQIGNVPLFDMESPIPKQLKPQLTESLGDYSYLLGESENLRKLFDKLRDDATGDGLSADSIQEYYDSVEVILENKGYRGLKHIGGLRTGKKAHEVKIYWHPTKDVTIEPSPASNKPPATVRKADKVLDKELEAEGLMKPLVAGSPEAKKAAEIRAKYQLPEYKGDVPPREFLSKTPAVKELFEAVRQMKRKIPSFERTQSQERAKRAGNLGKRIDELRAQGLGVKEAGIKAMGELKGELAPEPEFTPPKLEGGAWDALYAYTRDLPNDPREYMQLGTRKALMDLQAGKRLTRGQIGYLEKQFGSEIGQELYNKYVPFHERVWDNFVDILGLPRTVLASGDISAIMRQARVLGQSNPKEWGQMAVKAAKAFRSPEFAKKIEADVRNSPDYKSALEAGLDLPEFGVSLIEPTAREERFMSRIAEKYIPLVARSEAAYVAPLNWFRMEVFSKLKAEHLAKGTWNEKNQKSTVTMINDLTGRTSLGTSAIIRKIQPILNAAFFSPRFRASRIVSMRNLVSKDPVVRKESAKAFAAFAGTNFAIMAALQIALGDKMSVEYDPRSTDFGKIRIGNQRIDLWAGYQPVIRATAQFITGKRKTAAGEIMDMPRQKVLTGFLRTAESPIMSLASDLVTGEDFIGRDFYRVSPVGLEGKLSDKGVPDWAIVTGREAYNRLTYMTVQDIVDAARNDGWPMALAVGPVAFTGGGAQNYPESEWTKLKKSQNEIAQGEYKKNWDELTPSQVKRVTMEFPRITEKERTARFLEPVSAPLEFIASEEKASSKLIHKTIDPVLKKELNQLEVRITGISRRLTGDWYMKDDSEYKNYQKRIIAEFNKKITPLVESKRWQNMSNKNKRESLKRMFEIVKETTKKQYLMEKEKNARRF